jgi:hypothetical protein
LVDCYRNTALDAPFLLRIVVKEVRNARDKVRPLRLLPNSVVVLVKDKFQHLLPKNRYINGFESDAVGY